MAELPFVKIYTPFPEYTTEDDWIFVQAYELIKVKETLAKIAKSENQNSRHNTIYSLCGCIIETQLTTKDAEDNSWSLKINYSHAKNLEELLKLLGLPKKNKKSS
jgi:hypothetical protein